MVILDMAVRVDPAIRVLTLDTGRLPEQTYGMIELVRERYGIAVETVSPDAGEVERMMAEHGPNLFYRDIASRMLCCQIRKVRPLERKLREFQAYMVGLRRDQNETRARDTCRDPSGSANKGRMVFEGIDACDHPHKRVARSRAPMCPHLTARAGGADEQA